MLPKPQSQSTAQNFLDIYDITNNFIILKDGTVSIVLSVGAMNFGLLAEAEQDAVIYTYAALLNSLNYPIQIIVQSQTKDVTDYLNLLKQQEEKASTDLKRERIARYRQFVSDVIKERNVLDKKFFVTVPANPTELGLITADSFVPGKSGFDISSFEKSVILEKAEAVLSPKRDHLISQFSRIGLFSRQLTTQEIIRIFYTSYNPEASEGQELTDTNQYTTPLVKANFINQTGELYPPQQPMQQDPQQTQVIQQAAEPPTNKQEPQQTSGQTEEVGYVETNQTQQDNFSTQQGLATQAVTGAGVEPIGQLATTQEQIPQQPLHNQTASETADVVTAQTQNVVPQSEISSPPLGDNILTNTQVNTPEPMFVQPGTQPTQAPSTINFSENLDDFEVKTQETSSSPTTTQVSPEIITQPSINPEAKLTTEPQQTTITNQEIAEPSAQPATIQSPTTETKQSEATEEDLQKTINQALQEAGEAGVIPTQNSNQPTIEPTPTVQSTQSSEPTIIEPDTQAITPPPTSESSDQPPETIEPSLATPQKLNSSTEAVTQPPVSTSVIEEGDLSEQKDTNQAKVDSLPPIAEI